MFKVCGVVLALLAAVFALPASAMDFAVVKSGGQRVVFASGVINPGDAALLAAALDLATRGKSRTKQLILNSPGGNAFEALAMADVMDRVGVSTVVPAHALCASACASVLFVSGRYRRIEKGGYLAIHSCFDRRNGQAAAFCNAVISVHADREGVSGPAMMAFQQVAGTHAALLFDAKNAACFGLTKQTGRAGARAAAPCIDAAMKAQRRR
jgi:hypothetical protein